MGRTGITVGTLVLAGALTACGSGSSSGSGDSAGSPTDAATGTFCKTFDELAGDVSPEEAADKLNEVGTPSDIGSDAQHGFRVLVDHLRQLPDDAEESDITEMARGLSGSDQADVTAFITYYAQTCQQIPTDLPS